MGKYLRAYLAENEFDAIIITHLYPAEALTYLKRRGELRQKVLAIATDYTCIPFWEETDCDWYISPHRDPIPEYVARGMDERRRTRAAFRWRWSLRGARMRVRREGGWGSGRISRCTAIMGGSMGFGKIQAFAYALCRMKREEDQVVIICGNNRRLHRFLSKELASLPNGARAGVCQQRLGVHGGVRRVVYQAGRPDVHGSAGRQRAVHSYCADSRLRDAQPAVL